MPHGQPRIAVIDDDKSVRRAIGRLLMASDFDVQTFASGQAFLDSLPGAQPDCAVLDLHMPGLDGLAVLGALARAGVTLPIIMVTGHDQPDTEARCLAAGAAAYLPKPLDDAALLQAIPKAIADRSGGRGSSAGDRANGVA